MSKLLIYVPVWHKTASFECIDYCFCNHYICNSLFWLKMDKHSLPFLVLGKPHLDISLFRHILRQNNINVSIKMTNLANLKAKIFDLPDFLSRCTIKHSTTQRIRWTWNSIRRTCIFGNSLSSTNYAVLKIARLTFLF